MKGDCACLGVLRAQRTGGKLIRPEAAERQAQAGGIVDPPGADHRAGEIVLGAAANGADVDLVAQRIVGDDVDHAADRVEAVQRGVRPLDDLDLADLVELHGDRGPDDAAVIHHVDLPAIDQHHQMRVGRLVVAADADIGVGQAVLPHIDAGDEAQHVGDAGGAGAADVVLGDDLDIRRGVGGTLRLAGHRRGDGLAEQLLQRAVIDRLGRGGAGNQHDGRGQQAGECKRHARRCCHGFGVSHDHVEGRGKVTPAAAAAAWLSRVPARGRGSFGRGAARAGGTGRRCA